MHISDFDYHLPEDLIAQEPLEPRDSARLLVDGGDHLHHRHVRDLVESIEPGDVLVAPNTDPAWTPLFMACGAVVVNVGAAISHAIIVSRELGLPCVVSATDATVRIPDGATIEVDGDTGAVTVLEVPL